MERPNILRRKSRVVRLPASRHGVGPLSIGGDSPVSVQSMTNTTTADAEATIAQIRKLAQTGADIVRVAAATPADTAALPKIVAASPVPIVADVHFHFERALEAIAAGVAKIRLNPGNISDRDQVRRVIDAASAAGAAIRVGVNEGSIIERHDAARRSAEQASPLADLMIEKMAEYLGIFEQAGFTQLVLSTKSHDAMTTVAVNRQLAERWDYPLHLGVTHAGTAATGAIRSAAALGTLLAEGIGDTIRISFAGDPTTEVLAGLELLWSLRLRERCGVEIIACPTCGRTESDVAGAADAVRAALADVAKHVVVAVMGCVVNGPGEADYADVALCCGRDKAVLYRRGKKLRTVTMADAVQAVADEVRSLPGGNE